MRNKRNRSPNLPVVRRSFSLPHRKERKARNMPSGQSNEANRQKQTLALAQAYTLPPKPRWPRVLLQSLVGVTVGMLAGGVLLWWLWHYSGIATPTSPRTSRASYTPKTAQTSKTQTSEIALPSLYTACMQEAKDANPGPAYQSLRTQQKTYALRWHLEWHLADQSLRQNKSAQAVEIYEKLAQEEDSPLPKAILSIRHGRALAAFGKTQDARTLLQRHARTIPSQPTKPLPFALYKQEVAEGLHTLASIEEEATKHTLWLRIWSQFSQSPHALSALQQWLRAPSATLSETERRWLLFGVQHWLAQGAPASLLRPALARLSRKSLTAPQRATFDTLQARLALQDDLWKQAMKAADQARKDTDKATRATLSFAMATLALQKQKRSLALRMIRAIRPAASYWRRVSMLSEMHSLLQQAKWKPILRLGSKSWRSNRAAALRAQTARYLGLSALGRTQYSKAYTYFSAAYKEHQSAGKRSLLDPNALLYWQAFATEMRRKTTDAKERYRSLFRKQPFHYNGFLAMHRLRDLDPQPLPFARESAEPWSFQQISDPRASLLLQTLQQHGPPALFLLELDRAMPQYAQTPQTQLHQMIAQSSRTTGTLHAALASLPTLPPHKRSQEQLHLFYPSPAQIFDVTEPKEDLRPFAALWIFLQRPHNTPTPEPHDYNQHPFFSLPTVKSPAHAPSLLALWKQRFAAFPSDIPVSARLIALVAPHPQAIFQLHRKLKDAPLPLIEALYPPQTHRLLFLLRLYQILYLPNSP